MIASDSFGDIIRTGNGGRGLRKVSGVGLRFSVRVKVRVRVRVRARDRARVSLGLE